MKTIVSRMTNCAYLANGQYIDIITNAAKKDGAHFNMPVCKAVKKAG